MAENDIEPRPTDELAVESGVEDEDGDHDTHRCGKCKLDFNSIEEFIRHKLDKDNCKILYKSRHRRVLLPHLVKKPIKTEVALLPPEEGTKENVVNNQPVKRKRGRPPNSKGNRSHIKPEAIIEWTNYECTKCQKTFHREATLRRHMEMIHDAVTLSDEEDGFAALQDDNIENDSGDVEFRASGVINPSSEGVPIIRGDDSVVEDVTGTSEGSNLETLAQALETLQSVPASETDEPSSSQDPSGQNLMEVALMQAKIIRLPAGVKKKPRSSEGDEYENRFHECHICKRRFKELSVLRAHMLTHSSKRDFPCPFTGCRYAFKTKGSLKRHVRRHTDERPFKCCMCDRAFRESGALTRHMKSRTPCVTKTDADLPRYGRIQRFKNMPEVTIKEEETNTGDNNLPATPDPTQGVPMSEMEVGEEQVDNNEAEIMDVAQRLESQPVVELKCVACGEEMPSHVKLKEHLQSHISQVPVPCEHCGFVAESEGQLEDHVKSQHNANLEKPVSDEVVSLHVQEKAGLHQGASVEEAAERTDSSSVAPEVKDHAGGDVTIDAGVSGDRVITLQQFLSEDGGYNIEGVQLVTQIGGDDGGVSEADVRDIVAQAGLTGGSVIRIIAPEGRPECEGVVLSGQGPDAGGNDIQLIIQGYPPAEGLNETREPEMIGVQTKGQTGVGLQNEEQPSSLLPSGGEGLPAQEADEAMQVDTQPQEHEVGQGQEEENVRRKLKEIATLAMEQMIKLGYKTSLTGIEDKDLIRKYRFMKKCPFCARTFRSSSYLRLHMRTHTGVRPHKCAHCLKAFTTRDALNKHLFCHTDDRQYKCGECGKMFKRISHVREHIKIHTNERPFVCQVCGKGFKTHNACKVHTRTHTMNMPWQCRMCSKSFREKGSLERHVRTHTKEKPFTCRHCGRKFAEHGTLNRHLKAKVPCRRSLYVQRQENTIKEEANDFPTVLAEFSSVVADTQQYIVPTSEAQLEQEATEVVIMGTEELQSAEGSSVIEIIADENNQIMNDDGTMAYVILNQTDDKITVLNSKTGETLELVQRNENDINKVIQVPSSLEDGSQYFTIATDQTLATFNGEVIASGGITEDQINEAIAIVAEQPITIESSALDIQGAIEQVGEIEAVAMVPNSSEPDSINTGIVNLDQVAFTSTTS